LTERDPHELPRGHVADPGLRGKIGLQRTLAALGLGGEATVGRFRIRSTLGRGGMGTVYRATDPELQRDVALKVLDRGVGASETMRREARALARLANPHVVAVYELGAEDGQAWVAMELVPGRTLAEHAAREPGLAWTEVVGLIVQAGRGLQAAHDAGVVHRDIKPENVMVREDGRVLVADFGLALVEEGAPEVAGTVSYLAPEVLRTGVATALSDQYSLAATAWRLLDPAAPLGVESARIPGTVREVLARALSTDPAARWGQVSDLVAALAELARPGPGAHHRGVLLQRVERLWIAGVLRASLGAPLPLPVEAQIVAPGLAPEVQSIADCDGAAMATLLEAGRGSLLVHGEPGAGKTLALLRLAEVLLERARRDGSAPMPVVLHLGSLGGFAGAVEDWVEQELVAKYNLPRRNVRPWLDDGELVLVLDGLDEIPTAGRSGCVRRLEAFRARFGVALVVACRTSDLGALTVERGFGAIAALGPVPAEVLRERLGSAAEAIEVGAAGLRTPLIVRLLEGSGGRPPGDEPPMPWLYERYLEHAFARRAVPAERRAELEAGLAWWAATLQRAGRSELWLEQLAPGWVFPDGRARAAHALAVGLLVAVCLVVNVTIGQVVEGDPGSGAIFGVVSAPLVLAFNGGLTARPADRLRFSWPRLVRQLPFGVGLGVAAGGVYGLFYLPWVNIFFGAVAGVVTVCTVAFEPSFHESGIRPNQGTWQALANGVGIGLVGLTLGALTFGELAVPAVLPYLDARSTLHHAPHPELSAAAVAGSLLGLIAGMVRGGWAVLVHVAVRMTLAMTTPVPARLVPLLDEAVDLGLLRRIGGGYLFPHRTFQEFLAARAR
jgi:hypothetical protein